MASVINEENIDLGLGQLEIGSYVNGAFVAYRNVGAIRGTATLTITRETLDYETGRPLQKVKREVIREAASFVFTMSELTIANLKEISGAGTSSSGGAPTFMDGSAQAPVGDLTDSYTTVVSAGIWKLGGDCSLNVAAVRFTHRRSCESGAAKRAILEIYRAQFGGTLTLPFNEADWNESEVTLEAQADFTRPAGEQLLQYVLED